MDKLLYEHRNVLVFQVVLRHLEHAPDRQVAICGDREVIKNQYETEEDFLRRAEEIFLAA